MVCREILNHFEAAGDLYNATAWLAGLQSVAERYNLKTDILCQVRLLTHKAELQISTKDDAAGVVLDELRDIAGNYENPWGRTPIALAHAGYYSSHGELDVAEKIIRDVARNVGIISSPLKELVTQDNARLRAYVRLHLADLLIKRKSKRYISEAMDLVRESYEDLRAFGEAVALTTGPHISIDEFETRYVIGSAWKRVQRKEISDLAEFSNVANTVGRILFRP
jgi:hypothetical protein